MQWRKTRPRASTLGGAVAGAVLLSGCGGGAEQRAAPPPTLPRAVALGLARASDGVAAALAAGDNCRALTLAQSLQQQTSAAVATARVPPRLRQPLQAAANDLASRIECTPPAPAVEPSPAERDDKDDKGKHKGQKKHGKGHD
jgi:hypothetical protein